MDVPTAGMVVGGGGRRDGLAVRGSTYCTARHCTVGQRGTGFFALDCLGREMLRWRWWCGDVIDDGGDDVGGRLAGPIAMGNHLMKLYYSDFTTLITTKEAVHFRGDDVCRQASYCIV